MKQTRSPLPPLVVASCVGAAARPRRARGGRDDERRHPDAAPAAASTDWKLKAKPRGRPHRGRGRDRQQRQRPDLELEDQAQRQPCRLAAPRTTVGPPAAPSRSSARMVNLAGDGHLPRSAPNPRSATRCAAGRSLLSPNRILDAACDQDGLREPRPQPRRAVPGRRGSCCSLAIVVGHDRAERARRGDEAVAEAARRPPSCWRTRSPSRPLPTRLVDGRRRGDRPVRPGSSTGCWSTTCAGSRSGTPTAGSSTPTRPS